jgi:hypothetical protein
MGSCFFRQDIILIFENGASEVICFGQRMSVWAGCLVDVKRRDSPCGCVGVVCVCVCVCVARGGGGGAPQDHFLGGETSGRRL